VRRQFLDVDRGEPAAKFPIVNGKMESARDRSCVLSPSAAGQMELKGRASRRPGCGHLASRSGPNLPSCCSPAEIGLPALVRQALRKLDAEEVGDVSTPAPRRARNVGRWIDPSTGMPLGKKCWSRYPSFSELDHEAAGRQGEPLEIISTWAQHARPTSPKRPRSMRTLKDLVRRDEAGSCASQQREHVRTQRIGALHRLELVGRKEALANRRLAEVDHGQVEGRVAEAAVGSSEGHASTLTRSDQFVAGGDRYQAGTAIARLTTATLSPAALQTM
jgi:hypothetical protein